MRRTGTTRIFLLASGLAIGLTLAIPGLAQSRPVGGEASSSPPARNTEKGAEHIAATLGGCPVDTLRAAWAGMDALETVAVNEEVARLCTARSEVISAYIAAQRDLNAALTTDKEDAR